MASISDMITTHKDAILSYFFGSGSAPTRATTNYYVALYTVMPTAAGGGTENADATYARQAISRTTGFTAAAASGDDRYVTNAAQILFPAETTGGTYLGYGICDSDVETTDDVRYFQTFSSSLVVPAGVRPRIPENTLNIKV